MTALEARCSNCASWRDGCAKSLAPPEGQLLCAQYEASPRFRQQIVSEVLREGIEVRIPLRARARRAAEAGRPLRGFRAARKAKES